MINSRVATGTKRRPAVVVSSDTYHSERPDLILAMAVPADVHVIGHLSDRDWQAVKDCVRRDFA